jgi:hypothetical protein
MSKRVYEVARELGLSTNEVMRRLNDAGVGVKSHLAVVEDHVYQRVFGDASGGHSSGGATPNGRLQAHEAEALPHSIQPPREGSRARRVLVHVLVAVLAFALAAAVGAMATLTLQGDLSLPGREELRAPDEQGNAPRPQEKDAAERDLAAGQQDEAGKQQDTPGTRERQGAAQQEEGAAKHSEAEYIARIGDIQADSVQTFMDSHDKLLRYDALNADDVEQMQSNQITLQETTEQVANLDPPQRYREQYDAFSSAIRELHRASELAYNLAADPAAATQSGFDKYDRHVSEAAAGLKRSNELLGRDYKTIEGVQRVNPLS